MTAAHRTPEWFRFRRVQRAAWQVRIDGGGVPCSKCQKVIRRGQSWDLGHLVAVRLGGALCDPANVWPECRACNRAEGARISHAIRYRARRDAEREPEW